jgi:phosphopantetheinyl transferase
LVWTRKEALLKAAGVGLSVDPALIELDELSILGVPPELGSTRDWTLMDLLLENHVAAVAVPGKISKLRLYDAR